MELHHTKHHQTYVTNLNKALQSYDAAIQTNDIPSQVALQPAIKFNAGGHINHSLFWQNLAPASSPEADPAAAKSLVADIEKTWGSLKQFKEVFSAALLGIQGSGWGWLVRETATGLRIVTTKDQDPVVGGEVPIFGVDMWEHAYYLQVSWMSSDSFFLFLVSGSLTCGSVSQRQGGIRREYLERDQLEDCGGEIPRQPGGRLQDPEGVDVRSHIEVRSSRNRP